jgi:hypothetical protein
MEAEDLKEGKHYRISWDDCCTAGHFTAKVARIEHTKDGFPPEISVEAIVFDNGVTLNNPLYGVEFEELK